MAAVEITAAMPGVAPDGLEERCQAGINGAVENDEPTNDETSTSDYGKVCILSIDGGGMRGIIPGKILAYLEEALQRESGNAKAKIADYFDVAAGTSVGGILTTMLFTNDGTGAPLFSGEESWKLIADKGQQIFKIPKTQRAWKRLRGIMNPRYSTKYLEGILKEYLIRDGRALTLRDTLKPVLIPCYDLQSAGPFLFSRASALDCGTKDFSLWEICRATSAVPSFFKPSDMTSVDGKSTCTAIDGGIVMNNPTAAAITHVLHNKLEFPSVRGMADLLVLSLGTGQFDQTYSYKEVRHWGAFQWAKPVVKIILDGISDMVDHTVSMSFGDTYRKNYVRVQLSRLPDRALTEMDDGSKSNVKRLIQLASDVLDAKSMEHLPFGGRRPLAATNKERLDWFAAQLVKEHRARLHRKNPTVILRNASGDRSEPSVGQRGRQLDTSSSGSTLSFQVSRP